jgi:hypothetical protein
MAHSRLARRLTGGVLLLTVLAGCAPDVQESLQQGRTSAVQNWFAQENAAEPECERQIKAVFAFYDGSARQEKGELGDVTATDASDVGNVDDACRTSGRSGRCTAALWLSLEHLQAQTHFAVQVTGDREPNCSASPDSFDACVAILNKFNKVKDCVNSKQALAVGECDQSHSDEECADAVEDMVQCSPGKAPQIPACGVLISAEKSLNAYRENMRQAEELDAAHADHTGVLATALEALLVAAAHPPPPPPRHCR